MPCCAAAKATDAAAESAGRTRPDQHLDQSRARQGGNQRADHRAAQKCREYRADQTEICNSLAREIGASSSQKPSAADANTGPNSRLAASATPTVAANAAHGRMARADRQEALLHCAIVRCAFKITLTTMAPIITAPKTAT